MASRLEYQAASGEGRDSGRIDMTLIQRAVGASLGVAALVSTVACGARDGGMASVQASGAAAAPQASASPVVVTCEPNQRTLVRPVVVNGAALSQVECVSIDAPLTAAATFAAPAVAAPQMVTTQVRPTPVVYRDLPEARVVQTEQPARVVPARQIVYRDEAPRRQTRSVAKSAVIIGSAAGGGAGIGALIGGKKGALIGAAAGGGGAVLWDQITRRKN
jgi:hypothetical protein